MKKIFILLCVVFLFTGCKKTIEKLQENAIVNAMTDGQWTITSFVTDGVDVTSEYSQYKFQFHSNRTVDAIFNGSLEKTGNWEGYAETMSISAQFPNTSNPLLRINGSWHIDNNSWTFVVASQQANGITSTMRLDKL